MVGTYIPNEKVAIFLVVFHSFFNNKTFWKDLKSSILFFLSGFLVLLIVILKLIFYSNNVISYVDFHYVAVILYLPFYINFFSNNIYFLRALKFIFYLQILVCAFQWVCILTGEKELSKLFNNYPYQEDYYFESFFGFVRVSGLFFESSQLAIFFLTCAGFYFKNRKFFYTLLLLTLSTYSFTGILGVITFILLMVKRNEIKTKYVVIISAFSTFFLVQLFQRLFDLINILFSSSFSDDGGFNRLSSLINKVDFLLLNPKYLFLGYANSFDFPSFDFFSVYIFGFGILGFIIFFNLLSYLIVKSKWVFIPVIICSIFGNSVILSSVVMFIYISGITSNKYLFNV